ncbi:TPA: DUF87 domain-containing protein, partial [Candidatus Bathyarchaeota archaeon]|nr:DUF87 domain-containing protein [Candidatus Bathyarchaeota archaeon]
MIAVPTGYRMKIVDDGLEFERSNLTPLVGSEAHILSKETVKEFLCVDGGVAIGNLIGFDLPLRVNITEMVRYHTGIFGFTGCGKSNLCSFLIRKALERMRKMSIVIFDVSGEYLIHLLDLKPRLFSTEHFSDDVNRVMDSQTIPETLEKILDRQLIADSVQRLIYEEKIQRLSLSYPLEPIPLTMGLILDLFGDIARSRRKESVQATVALNKLNRFVLEGGYDDEVPLEEIGKDIQARTELEEILQEFMASVHSMSGTVKDVQTIISILEEGSTQEYSKEQKGVIRNAEWLATQVAVNKYTGVNIVYLPDPTIARQVVSRFINQLLWLKKT